MDTTSSGLFQTEVPNGGFKIDRRKDALIQTWANDDLDVIRPFEDSPCLHRVLAESKPDPEAILALANKWGLLTTAPEPLEVWRQEIRTLRSLTVPKLERRVTLVQCHRFLVLEIDIGQDTDRSNALRIHLFDQNSTLWSYRSG